MGRLVAAGLCAPAAHGSRLSGGASAARPPHAPPRSPQPLFAPIRVPPDTGAAGAALRPLHVRTEASTPLAGGHRRGRCSTSGTCKNRAAWFRAGRVCVAEHEQMEIQASGEARDANPARGGIGEPCAGGDSGGAAEPPGRARGWLRGRPHGPDGIPKCLPGTGQGTPFSPKMNSDEPRASSWLDEDK